MGGWLTTLLLTLQAEVTGYALQAPTDPSFFAAVGLGGRMARSVIADIRDLEALTTALHAAQPSVVFHLAAQPLVRTANAEPLLTYDVNVMGTAKLLEAVRTTPSVDAVVVVTTDKVYLNRNWDWPYRECDRLGGKEPYASSKAGAELVIDAYRHVYFHSADGQRPGVASIRAGNIIGGGDWADSRLVPDAMRAFHAGRPLILRHPQSTRPWQHVLDPLPAYLSLAEQLIADPAAFSEGWNLGPARQDARPVGDVAERLCVAWGDGAKVEIEPDDRVFEEKLLSLDSSKAHGRLHWRPRWRLDAAIDETVRWYRRFYAAGDVWALTGEQIRAFLAAEAGA
ncbi:MAG: CDP-glucose 4,6-dehydratase [Proteobacteria bacterium]|nr:CDP-glucose 4,6-dehydratase [Pseudomonadota bacterium]